MLVFIHINKTAGSTVRYMLRSTYGVRHCDENDKCDNGYDSRYSSGWWR